MSYDLQAEGNNGVRQQTTVVALPGFASEFNISVWNVDATVAPAIDAVHGFTASGATGVLGKTDGNGVAVLGEAGNVAFSSPRVNTGVGGIGDVYGGVFEVAPRPGAETFANVQLSPHKLLHEDIAISLFKPDRIAPRLPRNGKPGDVLAVSAQPDPDGVKLWVCIKPATQAEGATWARVAFDLAITTRHP